MDDHDGDDAQADAVTSESLDSEAAPTTASAEHTLDDANDPERTSD